MFSYYHGVILFWRPFFRNLCGKLIHKSQGLFHFCLRKMGFTSFLSSLDFFQMTVFEMELKNGLIFPTNRMSMNRLMVIRIEKEHYSKILVYLWHDQSFLGLHCKDNLFFLKLAKIRLGTHSRAHPARQLFRSCPFSLCANGTKVSSDARSALPGQIGQRTGSSSTCRSCPN